MILFKAIHLSDHELQKMRFVTGINDPEEALVELVSLIGKGDVVRRRTPAETEKLKAEAQARLTQIVTHWQPTPAEEDELLKISASMDQDARNERTAKKIGSAKPAAKVATQKANAQGAKKRRGKSAAKPAAQRARRAGIPTGH